MSGVRVVQIDREERLEFAEEGIEGILLGADRHASYTVGIVPPGGRQRRHVQQRPENGTEIIFFFAGQFVIEADGAEPEPHDVSSGGPVLVVCPSGTAMSVVSTGAEPVRFFSVFAPAFAPGEVTYLD